LYTTYLSVVALFVIRIVFTMQGARLGEAATMFSCGQVVQLGCPNMVRSFFPTLLFVQPIYGEPTTVVSDRIAILMCYLLFWYVVSLAFFRHSLAKKCALPRRDHQGSLSTSDEFIAVHQTE
jgi:hypothetical protein